MCLISQRYEAEIAKKEALFAATVQKVVYLTASANSLRNRKRNKKKENGLQTQRRIERGRRRPYCTVRAVECRETRRKGASLLDLKKRTFP